LRVGRGVGVSCGDDGFFVGAGVGRGVGRGVGAPVAVIAHWQ
jgi:hypothetical protein